MADRVVSTTVDNGGRVVIPAVFRKELGVKPGDEVLLSLENGRVHLYTRQQARRSAQELVCHLIPADVALADDLIRERRREASDE